MHQKNAIASSWGGGASRLPVAPNLILVVRAVTRDGNLANLSLDLPYLDNY